MKPSALAILRYLQVVGPSTGAQMREACGQEDWRKRISELRAAGVPIDDVWETGPDKFGNMRRFKKYFVKENKNG